ncbi:MAG: aspartate kinase [Candidatus Hadarchaeum sp.]|uniref:aspartate kinase n=1 Tax=Candidatus Hadarchaeum sp. TaxID=2883567 RepID=UPI00317E2299
MKLVIKFGGVPVKDGESIKKDAELVVSRHKKGDQIAVVTSAMAGVTDQLLEIARKLVEPRSNPREQIPEFLRQISIRHYQACQDAIKNKEVLGRTTRTVRETIDLLERALTGISYLGELSPRSQDLILSFGERLSAPILSGSIESLGVKSRALTGFEAGLITDDHFTEARPLMEKVRRIAKQRINKMWAANEVPVITGFIGGTEDGVITTLGRGGSDYTASILGAALGVDEIWIMTDVDGIMTADPKVEPNARVIKTISYIEATELAYFGAKVLHPKMIRPAMDSNIPVRVLNAFKPNQGGTLIIKKPNQVKDIVKSITMSKNVSLITVGGAEMIGVPGVAATVFDIIGRAGVKVLMISQSSSQADISFVVDRKEVDLVLRALRSEFERRKISWDISCERNVSVIAAIGAGMKGTPGVAARVFGTIGRSGINILTIAQGSSELNISFTVDERDAVKAVRALHSEFQLDRAG